MRGTGVIGDRPFLGAIQDFERRHRLCEPGNEDPLIVSSKIFEVFSELVPPVLVVISAKTNSGVVIWRLRPGVSS